MFMKEKEFRLEQCYHCGNKGLMELKCECHQQFGGEIDGSMEEHFTWTLLKCKVCNMITLIQVYTDETMCNEEHGQEFYKENIYPLNNYNMKNVPNKISSAFEAALKVKNIDLKICMMGMRRVLELICKDNSARGRNLEAKIEDMINKNIFPREMESAYTIIRKVGNDAAHSDRLNLSVRDVDEIFSLLYSIINYLYIIPSKMLELKAKIEN